MEEWEVQQVFRMRVCNNPIELLLTGRGPRTQTRKIVTSDRTKVTVSTNSATSPIAITSTRFTLSTTNDSASQLFIIRYG
jgi:hypothetical protein